MRVVIARTMPEFSMDVYADGLVAGLKAVRPDWDIVDLKPRSIDRKSRSLLLRIWKYYERFWHFPHTVKQHAADIFHIIDPAEAHMVYGLRKLSKPTVVTCHDLVNFFYADNLQGSVQLPIVSKKMWLHAINGMAYANHIVAISTATAKDTTEILKIDRSRIAVIPNAVEATFQPLPKHESETLRRQQGITPETCCLLNVGSNHPRKNLSTMLEALHALQQQGIPVMLWKTGADFTDQQKAFIQAQGLATSIQYLGKPDKATLVRIYNAADLLLAPSLHEGFGLTILEAMACGTPVITSNVSAMPEVAGDAGILVDPLDAHAIADAVDRLHKDPVYYQQLVKRGLERVKAFTWEQTAAKVAEVYEYVLEQTDANESATTRLEQPLHGK